MSLGLSLNSLGSPFASLGSLLYANIVIIDIFATFSTRGIGCEEFALQLGVAIRLIGFRSFIRRIFLISNSSLCHLSPLFILNLLFMDSKLVIGIYFVFVSFALRLTLGAYCEWISFFFGVTLFIMNTIFASTVVEKSIVHGRLTSLFFSPTSLVSFFGDSWQRGHRDISWVATSASRVMTLLWGTCSVL